MENIQFLDADWQEVFIALYEPPLITLPGSPSQGLENDAMAVFTLYNVALHWAIKEKWQKRHRIPYKKNLVDAMKPFGILLSNYIELCIQCHSFLKPNPYPTAAAWFWSICREAQRNTVFKSVNISKTESLADRRKIINNIAEGINPISKELAINEWRLVECALSFRRGDNFDKYLRQFIRAYRSWINTTKGSEWGAKLVECDNLFIREGRGKGKIVLDFKSALAEAKSLK